ncbi:MAG: ABC transporter permease [Bacteroidota bacterium]|nr:ABC transporter permease [Bacteroidota bacterium]MDP4217161.1 ABC transporter permease [Bacteroidota bacterium]MDP4244428.1 ABC transporter permease [Bacteroidota bacterium]MDP4256253.1 ABC transporter permease [Bacteroidota bacterium]MDP4260363.1 ABC transporter permease [Bacteroidota bacterium]
MSQYPEAQELLIAPGRAEKNYWKDLLRYRELFYILSWRDIKVRYKQTVVGAAWSVIRPVLTTLILTVVFVLAGAQYKGRAPYALMVFAGMLPWQFFSNALSDGGNALVGNANLISKVYFPRIIIPASSVITSLIDFAISFVLLAVMMIIFRFVPDIKIFLLPIFILLVILLALGTSLYIASLNVKFRDFKFIVPFIVQFGLYLSPVGISSSRIPEKWRLLYSLNPMVGIIDGFRWCLLGDAMYWPGFMASLAGVAFFLWLGIWYFRKTEKSFADNI